jgi:diaminohydroxyphosphoribosylaminopyrimidine deaminase/5-amino-6-(5-phosphoribosylamino)uracil reductase
VLRVASPGGGLDLAAVLRLLAARGVTRLMVEGGPTLAAALLRADLVDEAVLFHSAKIIGARGIDALNPVAEAALMRRLKPVGSEPVGADRQDRYERG